MNTAETAYIKHIFLDIVSFTEDRSVEAQSYLVNKISEIVTGVIANESIPPDKIIYLPTGDGICIALIELLKPYDIHLKIALNIIETIHKHNSTIDDKMRNFEVRVGLNENVDNLIVDINKKQNVAGLGINMAQRIMDKCDGSQILVGEMVYEKLKARERYMHSFRKFIATAKHNIKFPVYQYVEENNLWLNNDIPKAFVSDKIKVISLSKLSAYYIAHSIKNEPFLVTKMKEHITFYGWPTTVLLYFLALDSVARSEEGKYDVTHKSKLLGGENASIDTQLDHYFNIGLNPLYQFAALIKEKYLSKYEDCFKPTVYPYDLIFVNENGRKRLKKEWPNIWDEFGLQEIK